MKPAGTTYNLARFDLVSIRLVVDCVQHGSLSAAARESHLALARGIRDAAVAQVDRPVTRQGFRPLRELLD